ncbi:class II aldolase/adducin family protein [Alteripontixanthobacter maritimus]|nr:class II aldolase/adducin family protein [Alteripontixanthobacter maritimus]
MKNAMLLRNHGTLIVSEEVGDAFLRVYFLERACSVQVRTLSIGSVEILQVPEGTADMVQEQNRGVAEFVSRQLIWPMLRRRMDRLDDGYKD